MTIRLTSNLSCFVFLFLFLKNLKSPANNFFTFFPVFFRMWNEIRKNAKVELLHVLFMTKVCLADSETAPDLEDICPDTFYDDKPPSNEILTRWKCVLELFERNEFI